MQVYFYTFSKRLNSTAQPTGGASFSCVLKSPSSVTAPKISLVWSGTGNPTAYNYAYIADYGRYYWVSNWTYADRQWTADLTVDVLASYKSQIGGANKYILRSASSYNPEAIDRMWPALSDYAAVGTVSGTSFGWDVYGSGGGTFVVSVVGTGNTPIANSAVALYQLSGGSVQTLINNQLNAIEGAYNNATSQDIFEAVQKLLMLPFRFTSDLSQYIRGIMWFPFEFASGGMNDIYLGMFECLQNADTVAAPLRIFTSSIDVSGFPGVGADDWEYLAPYGSYTLELQPFGLIPLDSADIIDAASIGINVRVDALSGLALLTVTANKGLDYVRTIAARTAQIGVAVPYGGTAPNYAAAISGAASAAAAFAASDDDAGMNLLSTIGSAVAAASTTGYSAGTSGGGAAISGAVFLHYRVFSHVDVDSTEAGRPLCENAVINTLSGFVQCRDGEISAPATSAELAQIASYLTGGFFYE